MTFSLKLVTALCVFVLVLAGCQTSDSTLREAGRSEAYVLGFHDGRHSGMKEAGNNWEHYIKDTERFDSDADYREGWLAGVEAGKRLQQQATAAGEAIGGAYTGYQVGKEADKAGPHPEKAAKDAMKGVNTDDLKVLEQ